MLLAITIEIEVEDKAFDGPAQVETYVRNRLIEGPIEVDILTLEAEVDDESLD